jgi:lysophospholipase L1-like esterase
MLRKLREVTPKVIWATTTPAPDRNNTLGPESSNAAVVARNLISKQIAADLGIEVNDLYELVIGRREQLQGFANLHFTPEGSQAMGEQIAARILAALQASEPKPAVPAK